MSAGESVVYFYENVGFTGDPSSEAVTAFYENVGFAGDPSSEAVTVFYENVGTRKAIPYIWWLSDSRSDRAEVIRIVGTGLGDETTRVIWDSVKTGEHTLSHFKPETHSATAPAAERSIVPGESANVEHESMRVIVPWSVEVGGSSEGELRVQTDDTRVLNDKNAVVYFYENVE